MIVELELVWDCSRFRVFQAQLQLQKQFQASHPLLRFLSFVVLSHATLLRRDQSVIFNVKEIPLAT